MDSIDEFHPITCIVLGQKTFCPTLPSGLDDSVNQWHNCGV